MFVCLFVVLSYWQSKRRSSWQIGPKKEKPSRRIIDLTVFACWAGPFNPNHPCDKCEKHRRTGPNHFGGQRRSTRIECLVRKNLGIRITYCTRYTYGNLNACQYPNSCSSLPIFENFSVLITLRNLYFPILLELFARMWSCPKFGGTCPLPPGPYAYGKKWLLDKTNSEMKNHVFFALSNKFMLGTP